MRLARSLFAALAVTSTTFAQLLPSSVLGLSFSPQCQSAILATLTAPSFAQCFPLANSLLPAVSMNSSLIPALDSFMAGLCYGSVCSNDTLNNATMTILSGCSSDLAGEGLSNATVTGAFAAYPLVREILCLKTNMPYTNTSYGGALGNAPIPISNSTYNSVNGTFCVTSVLTQLSAYFGTNLTLPYLEGILSGMNTTAAGLVSSINPNVVCNSCIFAALDLIEDAYPSVGNVSLTTIFGALNMTAPTNATVNQFFNGECSYVPLMVSMNGTLPANTTVSIANSTFPFNVTKGYRRRSMRLV